MPRPRAGLTLQLSRAEPVASRPSLPAVVLAMPGIIDAVNLVGNVGVFCGER